MKILGIVPARGGSKGVKRKNIKLLNNNPLLFYTIAAAKKSQLISNLIVNTEDKEIADYAISQGVQVQNRPEEFWHDNTFQEVDRLLVYSVKRYEEEFGKMDIVVLLYPTAPLRTSVHIDDCIKQITSHDFDSSLSLYEDRKYIWRLSDKHAYPVNYDPKNRGPNQLEGWNQWFENKAVYCVKRDLLISSGCRIGGNIGFTEMSKLESIDIDTPEDFELAETLIKNQYG